MESLSSFRKDNQLSKTTDDVNSNSLLDNTKMSYHFSLYFIAPRFVDMLPKRAVLMFLGFWKSP